MEKALSLKTNGVIFAKDLNYEMSKRLIPVCPECKEPVHLRKKITTTGTSHFAHYTLKGENDGVCSLRVFGYWDQIHINSGMWANRGQLVEKIQLELIAFFSDQFGEDKEKITISIKRLIDAYREFEWIYTDLLEHLAGAEHIYKKIRDETTLGNDDGREIVNHYNLAIACLNGARLNLAVKGLLWCSFIVAHSLSNIYKKDSDPPVGVICDGKEFDFCLDPKKYRTLIVGSAQYPSNRNHIYYRCVSISQRLLIRLLTSWRFPDSLRRDYVAICETPHMIDASVKENALGRFHRTPLFRTLEERDRWLSKQKE